MNRRPSETPLDQRPPITECGRCGQKAFVGSHGIACACLPWIGAKERMDRAADLLAEMRKSERAA